jgi:uncharacterized protein (DUF433 family)
MEIAPRVTVEPDVAHRAPVIADTRVSVSIVIGSLAGGMSNEEVMREYQLSREDIKAALAYAADLVAKTEAVPLVGAR